jgi:hypothetical protein
MALVARLLLHLGQGVARHEPLPHVVIHRRWGRRDTGYLSAPLATELAATNRTRLLTLPRLAFPN